MKEYTEKERLDLIARAKEKARRLGISEDAIGYIDSHCTEIYQIENIEDFLKIPDSDITEYSFVEWFTLDNETINIKGEEQNMPQWKKTEYDYINTAVEIAIKNHRNQVDKIGMPYILHPMAVASLLDTPEQKCAGLLHDILEDTEVTEQDLLDAGIPKRVIEIVKLVTHEKPCEGKDYEDYLAKIKADPDARAVKLADLAHNTDPKRVASDDNAATRQAKYEKAKVFLQS